MCGVKCKERRLNSHKTMRSVRICKNSYLQLKATLIKHLSAAVVRSSMTRKHNCLFE